MIERAFIQVGGPPGSGKTVLFEAVLARCDLVVLAARCRLEHMRLRRDDALVKDILSRGRDRRAITAVVANLADPRDPGRRKAVDRIRRSMRPRSE